MFAAQWSKNVRKDVSWASFESWLCVEAKRMCSGRLFQLTGTATHGNQLHTHPKYWKHVCLLAWLVHHQRLLVANSTRISKKLLTKKYQTAKPKYYTARRLSKLPDLTYLEFRNATWQRWLYVYAYVTLFFRMLWMWRMVVQKTFA